MWSRLGLARIHHQVDVVLDQAEAVNHVRGSARHW